MSNPSRLKFDHKEIAVIFSLFIFVSLLMFTVGILVGKGLTQAKYEAMGGAPIMVAPQARNAEAPAPTHSLELTPDEMNAKPEESKPETKPEAKAEAKPEKVAKKDEQPLELIPADSKRRPAYAGLKEPKKDALHVMNNPKLKNVIDEEVEAPKTPQTKAEAKKAQESLVGYLPRSFSKGPFTVQVGSYPTEKDAQQRIDHLKKLGFPHSFYSAKELGDQKNKWYRVYLGYYFEFESAKQSSELLAQRGEVKNYLVRKTEDIQ